MFNFIRKYRILTFIAFGYSLFVLLKFKSEIIRLNNQLESCRNNGLFVRESEEINCVEVSEGQTICSSNIFIQHGCFLADWDLRDDFLPRNITIACPTQKHTQ